MKLLDVVVFSVILCLFSSICCDFLSTVKRMDDRIEELHRQNACLTFVSESFYLTCEGDGTRGFSSLEEWKRSCGALWHLQSIEWKLDVQDSHLICGLWTGPDGEGKVYYRWKKK